MKKMILMTVIALLVNFTVTYAQNASQEPVAKAENPAKVNGPVATFDKTTFEFTDLTQGVPGTASFNLKNDGNEPLIISSANASCGCTNLTYSKDPILPGKSISISATYNAAAAGPFTKTVTVRTNASDQPVVLMIKGKVNPKPATETTAEPKPASK
jgi:archaellum component FlaF (FlaF/FlaG flagellin family)